MEFASALRKWGVTDAKQQGSVSALIKRDAEAVLTTLLKKERDWQAALNQGDVSAMTDIIGEILVQFIL
jgi:hypothetical protein